MAVVKGWQKKLPEEIADFRDRDLIWLWFYLRQRSVILEDSLINNSESRAIYLIKTLKGADYLSYEEINKKRRSSLVPEDSGLLFINKANSRLASWLWVRMIRGQGFHINGDIRKSLLSINEKLVASFDIDERPVELKSSMLLGLRKEWAENVKIDRYLEWINERNEHQSFWLLDEALSLGLPMSVPNEDVNSPIDSSGRVLKFKCQLDQLNLPLNAKLIIVRDLKKRWESKGKEKSKDKVQGNFLINEDTLANVKYLKKKLELNSTGAVIEKLVSEYMSKE